MKKNKKNDRTISDFSKQTAISSDVVVGFFPPHRVLIECRPKDYHAGDNMMRDLDASSPVVWPPWCYSGKDFRTAIRSSATAAAAVAVCDGVGSDRFFFYDSVLIRTVSIRCE